MAQVLKEETRKKIIEAAKDEFLKYGFDAASMRRIALKSNMTVGNLYRYFKNKEDINCQIVNEVVCMIDNLVKSITDNGIAFFSDKFQLPNNKQILKRAVNELADKIVEIYTDHKDEFNILMMGSQLNNKLMLWFTNLINFLIKESSETKDNRQMFLLAKSYSVSVISGLKELFRINDVSIEELKSMVRIYLQSFIYMLQTDVRKYGGEKNELY
ncbi:MAG: TetR/AcrR family transcriptional regulator [Erysipelotrichia bacterium]|nr:TetR/AcrR family transcriptional regulator [Erysipelotrichia bacterium]